MTEEKQLLVPPEPIPENVKRMAWLLFLEVWKQLMAGEGDVEINQESDVEPAYKVCLETARTIYELEQPEKEWKEASGG